MKEKRREKRKKKGREDKEEEEEEKYGFMTLCMEYYDFVWNCYMDGYVFVWNLYGSVCVDISDFIPRV